MSDQATEAGRTGRRRMGGEAAPSELPPEGEAPVGMEEGEMGVETGVYFTKARGRDLWHAYDRQDDSVGKVWRDNDGQPWKVKLHEAGVLPMDFVSAPVAKAFVAGFFYAKGDAADPTRNDPAPGFPGAGTVAGGGGSREGVSGTGASGSATNAGAAAG